MNKTSSSSTVVKDVTAANKDPTTLSYWSKLGQKMATEASKALTSSEPVFASPSPSLSSSSSSSHPQQQPRYPRKLYLVEFPGRRRLGLQLASVPELGLVVKGFGRGGKDEREGEEIGEAEEGGMVAKGDVIHAVNGVTVVSLPVNVRISLLS